MDSKSGYKLVRSVKADTFDSELLDQYTLLLQIGPRDIQAAAFHDSRLEWLEDYALPEVSDDSAYCSTLKSIRFNSAVLSAGFWKSIVVCIKGNHFIQIPQNLLSTNSAADYLQLNARFSADTEVLKACSDERRDIVTLFGISAAINDWVDTSYPHTPHHFIHQSAALISGVLASPNGASGSTMHMITDRFVMHLVATSQTGLLYYNQFAIKDFSDYTKYLSVAFHVLEMDPETCPVILWGFITRQSPHAQELLNLVRLLDFGKLRPGTRFGIGIGGIQDHQYPDLFSACSVSPVAL